METEKMDTVAENFIKVFPVVIKYFIMLGDRLSDPEYSYQEYQALHILKEYEKLPISTVGNMLLISKPRMTVIVDKLISAGLIKRYPDKDDRRVIKIGLTKQGWSFTSMHRQNLKEGIMKRFQNLNNDELDEFLSAMTTLQNVMTKTKSEEEYW